MVELVDLKGAVDFVAFSEADRARWLAHHPDPAAVAAMLRNVASVAQCYQLNASVVDSSLRETLAAELEAHADEVERLRADVARLEEAVAELKDEKELLGQRLAATLESRRRHILQSVAMAEAIMADAELIALGVSLTFDGEG